MAAAAALTPFALAWRFAHVYRSRAGYPTPRPPTSDPSDVGLAFDRIEVDTPDGLALPAWWIPAGRDLAPDGRAPVVVLVHGWESARHRTLPNAQFLHALGYHVLSVDIRGHGANPPEELPVSAGEFGTDARAAVRAALADPRATDVAILGHSMGSIGAILAAAAEPRVSAVVLTATPADPYRLTRQTFRLARLPIPDPIAYPLAVLTTRVYLQPRGHRVEDISAAEAIRTYQGPILALHGTDDRVVPFGHLRRLVERARRAREADPHAAPVVDVAIPGGQHSWMYEFPAYRAAIGRFLATHLPVGLAPDEAARIAAGIDARRPVEHDHGFSALEPVGSGPRTAPGSAPIEGSATRADAALEETA